MHNSTCGTRWSSVVWYLIIWITWLALAVLHCVHVTWGGRVFALYGMAHPPDAVYMEAIELLCSALVFSIRWVRLVNTHAPLGIACWMLCIVYMYIHVHVHVHVGGVCVCACMLVGGRGWVSKRASKWKRERERERVYLAPCYVVRMCYTPESTCTIITFRKIEIVTSEGFPMLLCS